MAVAVAVAVVVHVAVVLLAAVAVAATQCTNCGCDCDNSCPTVAPTAVDVTIGLFAVVKLLRLSNMSVNTYGNCMPCECSDISDTMSPCDFFDSLKFPTDLFAPQVNYRPCRDISGDTPTNGNCCETC